MLVGCPRCKARYRLDESRLVHGGVTLRCTSCRSLFRISGGPALSAPVGSATATATAPVSGSGPELLVLIANESPAFCAAVEKALASEPFRILLRHDGPSALDAITRFRPQVAVLDVALPGMYGFAVCEAVKRNSELSGVKVILIASIYDRTRYKREPASLYGADDYIEKHHIPDDLASKVYRLLTTPDAQQNHTVADDLATNDLAPDATGLPLAENSDDQELLRQEIRAAEEREAANGAPVPDAAPSEAELKARRLARLIVSDIVLYNQELVEQGVRNGTFRSLLAADLAEGQALFRRRVPEELLTRCDYLDEAIELFIVDKRRQLGLA